MPKASHDRDPGPLARRPEVRDNAGVSRLRALVATLACLAVLAGGFVSVAASAFPANGSMAQDGKASMPCSQCHDCDGVPCQMPAAAACLHVPASPLPLLVDACADLSARGFSEIHWSLRTTALSGLSLPPDPFPPRA